MIMKIRYDRKLCKLIVCKLVEEHNHPVSAQIFQKYPQNRRPTEEERQEIERLVQLKVRSYMKYICMKYICSNVKLI